MRPISSRRLFLLAVPCAGLPLLASRSPFDDQPNGSAVWSEFPRVKPELARAIVGASHGQEEKVRELLALHPALSNAAWDWGFGDWETALGAASHTGRRAIAECLIEHGARVDIFAAAMLGWIDVVKAFINVHPGVQRTLGPHCITLLRHAKAGGEPAAEVVEYLTKLGDADVGPPERPLSDEAKQIYVGEYAFGPTSLDRLTIRVNREVLEFQRQGGDARRLTHVGDHSFSPAGAPAVRVRFTVERERATALTVVDHETILTAQRI